ncbi:MAG: hypothetical protein WA966_06405 [Ornithinimicrobium sp.]
MITWPPAFRFVEVAEDVEELPVRDDELFAGADSCSRSPGMIQRPPSRKEFAETSAATVVSCWAAMSYTVSPGCTTYPLALRVENVGAGPALTGPCAATLAEIDTGGMSAGMGGIDTLLFGGVVVHDVVWSVVLKEAHGVSVTHVTHVTLLNSSGLVHIHGVS